jgi:SpoVK/Ycf46/Vps4 family AAA+-type ATPase
VGLAGCGKTQAGKAVSAALDLPLYKFDMGSVFKGVVGQSEATVRTALRMAENIAPCVLLLDEFEKSVAGLESSGKSDSGVTSRVVSTILTWMQETKAPIYKMATCNTIRNLDPALLRRGRWDAVFAVDLPTPEEREQIFAIHLKKRGRNPENFDLRILSKFSDGFVGAEVESAVEEALYIAFDSDRDLETADIARVCKSIVPISKTDAETIRTFRDWIQGRAQNVSRSKELTAEAARKTTTERSLRVSTKLQ